MPLNDYYSAKQLNHGDPIIIRLKLRLNKWANAIPYHPFHDFGDKIQIDEVYHRPVYLFYMENHVEERTVTTRSIPYTGQVANGIPDLRQPLRLSLDGTAAHFEKKTIDYDYYGQVSNCYGCDTKGYNTCTNCNGAGRHTCGSCGGRGQDTCYSCSGRGESDCSNCNYWGQVSTTCYSCSGRGNSSGYVTCSSCGGRGSTSGGGSCWSCSGSGRKYEFNNCYSCGGSGTVKKTCGTCGGSKKIRCTSCDGSGKRTCSSCGGSGSVRCSPCGGSGKITCRICDGRGRLIQHARLTQRFSHTRSTPKFTTAEISKIFTDLMLSEADAEGGKPIFTSQQDLLPASVTYGNSEIDIGYQAIQQKTFSTRNGSTAIKQQKFQIFQINTWQIKCKFKGKYFDFWICGDDYRVFDGGSPIKTFRRKLIEKSSLSYFAKSFYDSYNSLYKAIEMSGVEPDEKDKLTLAHVKSKLLLAYDLGILAFLILQLYLYPLFQTVLRKFLNSMKPSIDDLSKNYILAGNFCIFFITVLIASVGMGWILRIRSSSLNIASDIKRFIIGGMATILAGTLIAGSLGGLTLSRRIVVFESIGSVFFSNAARQETLGFNDAQFDKKDERIRKTKQAEKYVKNTLAYIRSDSAVNVKINGPDTVETPERRQTALNVLRNLIKADISLKDVEAIYNLLQIHLAKDGKQFYIAGAELATAVDYPFEIKFTPVDLNRDGSPEIYATYGNAYTSGQSKENILFLKNEVGDYQRALSYTGDEPRFYVNPQLLFPEILVDRRRNAINIYRWEDGRFILNRESNKYSTEYTNSLTLRKAQLEFNN